MADILTLTMNPALDVWADTPSIEPSHKLRCDHVCRHPGGGGINVARVLHRFGAQCTAVHTMGGATGQGVESLLKAEGVPAVAIPIVGTTRENLTVSVTGSGQEFRFVLPGPELSPDEWQQCLHLVESWRPAPRFIVASGSLPPGVPDDFYARLGRIAKADGIQLVLDASGPALTAALEHGVFLVKPSWKEMRQATGHALLTMDDVGQAANDWVQAGRANHVAVSLGDQGALLATANGVWQAYPVAVKVVSAVGAGDSFVAGMTWALAQGMHEEDVLRHGVACGSAALMRPGTNLCIPFDVQGLLPQVRCEKLRP